MGYDKELEEILASIKKDKEALNELLAPFDYSNDNTKKALSRTERNAEPVVIEEKKPLPEPPEAKPLPEKIPEPEIEEPEIEKLKIPEPPKPSISEIPEVTPPESEPEVKEKKDTIPFKARLTALMQLAGEKLVKKQLIIIAAVIAALVIAAVAGVKIYDYSKTAYLKPYEQKYGITYPEGILEQFCDRYGKNQSTVGAIRIDDDGKSLYVTSEKAVGNTLAPKGTDVYSQQQFRSIDVNNLIDIEGIYSTSAGYINASQLVTFNTLFEKKDYQVIAAYYTNKLPEDDNGYVFPYNIYGTLTEKSFDHFADSIKHRSIYDTGYTMTYDKNYISVYCDSDFMPNFVFVIVCVEIDSEILKITNVSEKEKIHYPQVWYDSNDKYNSYIFSGHWYPEIITDPEMQKCKKLTAEDFDF